MNGVVEQPSFQDAAGDLIQPLRHYLERYVGDGAAAQDLTQETLIRMDKGFASFAGRSSLKTWAFSIANRVAADYLRHPDRKLRIVEIDDIAEPIDPDRAVDEQMMAGEMNACIRSVIDSLPESYRAAILLHDIEGLSVDQVGEICDCSVATVKIRIHRARRRLKESLTQQCDFYRDQESVFRCGCKD